MYIRNNKYSRYNIDGFPPNYAGQFKEEEKIRETAEPVKDARAEHLHNPQHTNTKEREPHGFEEPREPREPRESKEPKEIKKDNSHSLFGNLFGGGKDGKKGGLLSGFFNKGESKDGGFLSNIEMEDLILLAVIFFLLKDGIEDDIIIILAIILLSS
jgi:hypothetical protein